MAHNPPLPIFALLAILAACAHSHSYLTWPQSTHPHACRLGRFERVTTISTNFGVGRCPGPCRLDLLNSSNPRVNFYPPNRPGAVWRRGQSVEVKYSRNNHPPSGFMRLSLVPVAKAMDKAVHVRNAFHYSCWGANARVATKAESTPDKFLFSISSGDGVFHKIAKAYYTKQITVPTCVPDGDYYLAFTWYGGIGGPIVSNKRHPEPSINEWSFFADYWSCSFIKIRGGPHTATFKKEFVNDMSQFSKKGCWTSVNRMGICNREPCYNITAKFMKPVEFDGKVPHLLTTSMYK